MFFNLKISYAKKLELYSHKLKQFLKVNRIYFFTNHNFSKI